MKIYRHQWTILVMVDAVIEINVDVFFSKNRIVLFFSACAAMFFKSIDLAHYK